MITSRLRSLLTCLCASAVLFGAAQTYAQDGADMLDQITLADGRQFTGNIVEETDDSITMEVIHLGMRTKQTWPRKEILEILHDSISVTDEAGSDTNAELPPAEAKSPLYDPNDPRHVVYKVPVHGIVGLDSHIRIMQMIWNEAKEARAKTIILEFDCEQELGPGVDIEKYRNFFEDLKRDARSKEIHVVVWIKQARGVALAYALMFPEIYFQPDGEMGGGWAINEMLSQRFSDPAVRAKMISAWVGICRGMAEEGGHDAMLCEAMIRPQCVLSMDYEGDRPHFRNDTEGEVVLDANSGDEPANALELSAKDADKYGISGGTYRSVDDLMFKLGFREYRYVEGHADDWAEKWADGWKDALEEYRYIRADMDLIDTYNEPVERRIAKKISKLREVQALMKKWPPLEVFIDPEQIYFEIDTYKKELRNLNEQNRPGSTNPGGGPTGKPGN
ncbi:MAG: hypothetical protein IT430_07315 [Phycisphaerales bacterium]|nr:hypothetical protein [Phycisphaerales bacterium]